MKKNLSCSAWRFFVVFFFNRESHSFSEKLLEFATVLQCSIDQISFTLILFSSSKYIAMDFANASKKNHEY